MSSSDDEGELDRVLGGAEWDELEAMNSSPQQPDGSQKYWASYWLPQTMLSARRAGTPRGGGPCQGPLSFSDACTTAMQYTYS